MSKEAKAAKPEAVAAAAPAQNARWWQWFFLYPTFGIALLSALPTWTANIKTVVSEVFQTGDVESTELVRFMEKNPECVSMPVSWIEAENRTKVDGIICDKTGDVWLRIQDATGKSAYKGIDVEELIRTRFSSADPFGFSAHASTTAFPDHKNQQTKFKRDKNAQLAQTQLAIVICQKFTNNVTLLRHLKVGDACYDELVDTRTGVVVSNNAVACRSSC